MSEEERISRESLLKKAAAVAGAVYAAPVLTSAAGAATSGRCAGKCHNDRRCQRRGGKNCRCVDGACRQQDAFCPCTKQDPNPCTPLEPCGANCGCFIDVNGRGACIDVRGGLCSDFQPCTDGQCPAGQVCFLSCCPDPLCADCCTGAASPAARSVGGAGALYLDG